MASYRGHLMFSTALGAAYGAVGVLHWRYDWGAAFLGAGLTAIGGMLPDLDSDSGVPLRELSTLAAAIAPVLLVQRLDAGFSHEQTLTIMAGIYLFVRYGISQVFRRFTVHRGMFHSVPAMLIAGLVVYLCYHSPSRTLRVYLAVGVMLGFLSHLVLDELCSVDLMGIRLRLNKFAGSAVKLGSRSIWATLTTYAILGGLIYGAWLDRSSIPRRSRFMPPASSVPGAPPPQQELPSPRADAAEQPGQWQAPRTP